ncbi:hypothetical protein J1605_008955 [Eschrichtius robustus]|uniref:Uncharacterized protein n=1 Tax=Eschrichtius robustus TaxID=9764 RepID=A0AB34GXM4_ESCRO|nr:hypothetical protein J1605_008955 [Eschrichtius robustus]
MRRSAGLCQPLSLPALPPAASEVRSVPGQAPEDGLLLPSSEKRHLQVNVTNPVQCSLHGKKCTVSVETRLNQPQPDFTKNRSGFILSVPGN